MATICWKSCYEIGVGTFDAEHQNLVRLVNALYEGIRQHQGEHLAQEVPDELILYTDKHFQHEEQYMEKYNYPAEARLHHQQEHQGLREQVLAYRQRLQSDPQNLLLPELFRFLRQWVLDHIVETDMQFGAFLRQHSVYDCGPPVL